MTAEQIIKKLTVLRGQQAKIDADISLIMIALEDGGFDEPLIWLRGDRSTEYKYDIAAFREQLKAKKIQIRPVSQTKRLDSKSRALPNH